MQSCPKEHDTEYDRRVPCYLQPKRLEVVIEFGLVAGSRVVGLGVELAEVDGGMVQVMQVGHHLATS